MPFFLPNELIEFEYLGGEESDTKIAESYRNDLDFAFFVVNFHYTKKDYDDLTPTQIAFIKKAWETKIVSDSQLVNAAVINAIVNANRKKGKRFKPLWQKKPKKVDKDEMRGRLEAVKRHDEKVGKGWVEKIYQANGKLSELKARKNGKRNSIG